MEKSRPRNIAGPVVRGPDFWGREPDIESMWLMLERGSILLTGPRRYGKSSLMYALLDQPRSGWDLVLIDVESLETPAEFLTTIAAELLSRDRLRGALRKVSRLPDALGRWIGGLLEDLTISFPDVGELKLRLREHLDHPEQWPEMAAQLFSQFQQLPGRLALIIDEFPMLMAAMLDKDEQEGLRFLKWFRTCRQSPGLERVRFLLGGSLNIEPRLERLASEALLGDLQRLRLAPLSESEAVRFIREVLEGEGTSYDEGVPEEIFRVVSSGVHYYLQVMLQECLTVARLHRRSINLEDATSVYREKVIGPENRHRFSHYHTRLKYYGAAEDQARMVLYHLCRLPDATVSQLAQALSRSGADPRGLEDLLARLEGDYYLIREGERVRFSDGLLKDWWLRNGTMPIGLR